MTEDQIEQMESEEVVVCRSEIAELKAEVIRLQAKCSSEYARGKDEGLSEATLRFNNGFTQGMKYAAEVFDHIKY